MTYYALLLLIGGMSEERVGLYSRELFITEEACLVVASEKLKHPQVMEADCREMITSKAVSQ